MQCAKRHRQVPKAAWTGARVRGDSTNKQRTHTHSHPSRACHQHVCISTYSTLCARDVLGPNEHIMNMTCHSRSGIHSRPRILRGIQALPSASLLSPSRLAGGRRGQLTLQPGLASPALPTAHKTDTPTHMFDFQECLLRRPLNGLTGLV